ncbi:MAG: TIGR00341 family protein [Acidimicrobiales bacterium]
MANHRATKSQTERLTRPREWWHRYLPPEERRRVMVDLAIVTPDAWTYRFAVMLTLAVIVATMGLLANSAAVVIGAMLLAPLMTPVLGTAAALAMGLPRKIARSTTRVVIATIWSISVAYVLGALLTTAPYGSEIIGRTRPDIKDLVVALAAGFAGSYATVRRDASAALPGVAVAVALVPPLGVVGLYLQAGEMKFAWGAFLLYLTNLAAIILASVITFVVTGFVPPRRLATITPRILAGTAISVAAVIAVSVLLQQAATNAAKAAEDEQALVDTIDQWIEGLALERTGYSLDGDYLSVDIAGTDAPPDDSELQALLRPILGDVRLDVQWTRTQRATTTTVAPTTTTQLSNDEVLIANASVVVADWFAEVATADYEIQGVFLDGDRHIRIAASGVGDPPDSAARELLRTRLIDVGLTEGYRLNWTPSLAVSDGTIPPTPVEVRQQAMSDYLTGTLLNTGTALESLTFDGTTIRADLIGETAPDATELTTQLLLLAGADVDVQLYFVERRLLPTTTSTSEP